MNRNAFKQLLKRYVAGTANEEEKALVDHWYELMYNDSITALSTDELAIIEQEMWNKIEQEGNFTKERVVPSKTPVRKIIIRWAAAAAIFTGISVGAYYLFSTGQQSVAYELGKEQNKLAEVVNTSSGTKEVKLEDGTTIVLQPSSKLAYPSHFSNDKREVYLVGEAFFNVAKNPAKPFLVHSGNLVTQVLGTSFTVQSDKETNQIVVSVKTGRVAVYEDKKQVALNNEQQKNNGAILTPNQKVIYDEASRHFTTSLVENPEPVLATTDNNLLTNSFSFDDVSLASVLDNIGKFYAVDILVENENIYQCRFTGNISNQTLYDKLAAICVATNHQYEIKGTKILIKGKGCN
ncbi:MAG: FecR domain-containing protein [Flavihumibacter sp.]|nr:FecR domain-containing protein [Flavihumibacter sp.]